MTFDVWSGSYSVPSHILLQELPDEGLIFLDLRSEEYFGLDQVGTRMYETLLACGDAEAALDKLAAEYPVEASVLRTDLEAFVVQLVDRGLLTHEPG